VNPTRIVFVIRKDAARWRDIETLDAASVDRSPERFRSGVDAWIAQGYLRLREPLRQSGIEAAVSRDFPAGEICVVHRDDLNEFASGAHRAYIVAVRADRPPVKVAQWVIEQNGLAPDSGRRRFLPHWPQPGLVARDSTRGERVANMAYFGRTGALPRWLSEPSFSAALQELGVALEIRDRAWHDYQNVDLVLACRVERPSMLLLKPATKLVNAWLAGVPALLADEPAFRALRESGLDYLAVSGPADVLAAVRSLQTDSDRYRGMIANGRRRAAAYSTAAITARWMRLLADEILPDYRNWLAHHSGPSRTWGETLAFLRAMWNQKMEAKAFRRQLNAERP
jgi:hypothetical protein